MLEAMRKYHEWLTRGYLESMGYWYKEDISALREGNGADIRILRDGVE